MDEPNEYSHGCPVEFHTTEYEIHAVHRAGFNFGHLTHDIVERNQVKKDCIIVVDAYERGAGKSRFTQHYIRTELWPEMYHLGLVSEEEWDWRRWTVFYDSDEYQAKFLTRHDGWAVLTDDEAWSKMFTRNSMRGTQKETMECFGVGRFLQTDGFIMTPGLLETDKIVRNTLATHWLHIFNASRGWATVAILKRCQHQHWPIGRAFWDCMGHNRYPFTFPKDLDDEFEGEKISAWDRYQAEHADYKAKRIERLRRREELLAKKQEKLETEFLQRKKRKRGTEGSDAVAPDAPPA